MYDYEFVKCPVEYRWGKPSADAYRAEVLDRARRGWRLVQIFIPNPASVPTEYELIFEKAKAP